MTDRHHLKESELAGFLDDDLTPAERASIESHLDACEACRVELIEVSRLVHEEPAAEALDRKRASPPRSRWRIPIGIVGLAAAAVFATLLVWPTWNGGHEQPVLERFGSEGSVQLEARFPSAGDAVPRDRLRFAWANHGTASYRITLTAEDGALVWSGTVTDTVVTPPADLDLPPGRTFFWYVDAIDIGIVARTGARAFTVAP